MKQKFNFYWSLFFIVLFSACSNNAANKHEKVKLQLNLDKDYEQTLFIENNTNSNSIGEMRESNEIKFKMSSISEDGLYTIKGEIVRIMYHSNIGGEEEKYDSKKSQSAMTPSELEMHKEMKEIINTPFTFTINNKGEIIQPVEFINGYDPDMNMSFYTNLPLTFPPAEISIGHEWIDTTAGPLLSEQKIVSKYKITKIDDGKIFIEVNQEIGEIKSLLGKNTTHGEYILDQKTNKLLSSEREMKMQAGGGTVTYKITSL